MARTVSRRSSKRPRPPGLAEEERPFVHDEIVNGIDARRVKALIERGVLGKKQVYRLIPERTFNRRLAERQPLKTSEADAIARLLRVTETAEKAFGDADFARKYLSLPNPTLGNQIPFDLAVTEPGARDVEAAISRFVHGDYI